MTDTIVSKYGLSCDQSVKNTLLTSSIYIGYFIGSAVGGLISDRFGRILTIKLFLTGVLVITLACLFIDSLFAYAFMRVLQGTFHLTQQISGSKREPFSLTVVGLFVYCYML